jgi:Ca2+-dependent lipid-binding protein
LEEKIEAALMQLARKETVEEISYEEPEEQVYDVINLKFRVIEASITHNTEALGDMSPYCLIKIRQKGDFKTDILKGKNPKFNQVFIIEGI